MKVMCGQVWWPILGIWMDAWIYPAETLWVLSFYQAELKAKLNMSAHWIPHLTQSDPAEIMRKMCMCAQERLAGGSRRQREVKEQSRALIGKAGK